MLASGDCSWHGRLANIVRSAGRVFHDDRNLMRRDIKPVCRKIGIAPFGWHSLRHTFSTYNGNNGVPMPVLQSLLGHRDAATTMIYTHPLEGAQRGAVEQLASVLFPNYRPNRNRVVR